VDERERFATFEAERSADSALVRELNARGVAVTMDGPDGGMPYHAGIRIESAGRAFVRSRQKGTAESAPVAFTRLSLQVERCGEKVLFDGTVVVPADPAGSDWPERVAAALAEKIASVLPADAFGGEGAEAPGP
jgi:hypothetical protein